VNIIPMNNLRSYDFAIAEAKQRSERSVIGWVTRRQLQSLASNPVSRRVDVNTRPVVKIIAESLSQHDEKHVVPTPLSGIMVGKRRKTYSQSLAEFKELGY
jgi:hypothetical protein